jgi:hypothetical protein
MIPPLLESYKYSTGQKVEIHKSTQFYLYQISHLPVKENLHNRNPTTGSALHLGGQTDFREVLDEKGFRRLRILCEPALRGVRSIFCLGREVAESEGTA